MTDSLHSKFKLKFITINIVYFFLYYSQILQAQTIAPKCKSKNYFEQYADITIEKCKQDRASLACQNLEKAIRMNGLNPETKLKQCNKSSARKELAFEYIPFVSTVSCLNGVADYAIDSVVNIGRMIGEFAGAIKVDYDKSKERSEKCNSSIENKMALYKAFNISTPKLMNISIPSKEFISKKECWQIEFDLREHSRIQQKKIEFNLNPRGLKGQLNQMSDDEKNFWQWSHPELSNGKGHTELLKTAKDILMQKGLELDCYSSYTAQALVCEAMTEAASILLGTQSGLKRLSQASKIPEIAGVSKEINIVKRINLAEVKSINLKSFGKKFGLATEPVVLDGETYMRIIPNSDGNWLERMAAVYKRKYKTDFLIQDHINAAIDTPAKIIESTSRKNQYRAMVITTEMDLNDKRRSMLDIAHELVHARELASKSGQIISNSDTPIYIVSANSKIPIEGYEGFALSNEVQAYDTSAKIAKNNLKHAESVNDQTLIQDMPAHVQEYSDRVKNFQNFFDQSLTNAKSAAEKYDLYDKPVKEYGYVRTTIMTYDKAGNEFPVVLEFPANTPTDPKKFKPILLDRIQREIDKNRKIVQGL